MVSPTVHARRCLCHLFMEQPDAALGDAMQAQCVYPDWPTAFYLQSVALSKLGMHQDAADMLSEAVQLEEKRQGNGKGSWGPVLCNSSWIFVSFWVLDIIVVVFLTAGYKLSACKNLFCNIESCTIEGGRERSLVECSLGHWHWYHFSSVKFIEIICAVCNHVYSENNQYATQLRGLENWKIMRYCYQST